MPIRVKDKTPKPPKEPKPDTPPQEQPPATSPDNAKLGAPTGIIGGSLQIAYGRGGPWATVNAHDPFFLASGSRYGVDPAMLKAMEVIESGGQMIPNGNGFPNWGNMQLTSKQFGAGYVTPWDNIAKKLGVDIRSAEGQIAIAAYALGGHHIWHGTPEAIFLAGYYPIEGGLDVKGPDGHTQRQYLDDMHELMRQIKAAGTPPPTPPTGDVLDLLFGGKPYQISATYGQLVTWSCPGCYDYFIAYGLDTAHHWAYDAAALAGDGAPLYAPFAGTVVCAGTGVGTGAWGTGCAAFPRLNNYGGKPAGAGSGRLELLHADGDRSLILGHALQSLVRAGVRVRVGDLIGQQGGMNASHVHVEGRYANGTRIGDPRTLFGGGPLPVFYADRQPFVLSDDNPELWVEATEDGVKVLQYANPDAAPVRAPLRKGERFEVGTQALGTDGAWWYVTSIGSRIPRKGTKEIP